MKGITRRQFIKTSAGAAGALAASGILLKPRRAYAFYQSSPIQLWQTTFRNAGAIPVALPDATLAPITGVKHYTINIEQFTDDLGGGGPTTLWGFKPTIALGTNPAHLGGIILANKGEPIQITFNNKLTIDGTPTGTALSHIIPVDTSIPGANQAQNRAAIHIHGGLVPWISDGGPFDYFAPDGTHGQSFLNNLVLNPTATPGQAEYYYPNDQSARLVWYHDHAWGITRINAYAGIATAYIIRDLFEADLVADSGLPPYVETSVLGGTVVQELPIVVQDKIFVDANTINTIDPTWQNLSVPQTTGSLWYAHTYDPTIWELQEGAAQPADPSVVAEFFGDTMLCNGTVYPEVNVEPRRYRLRVLNACNARFLNLQLYVDDGSLNGITLDPKTGNPLNLPFSNAAAPNPTGRPTGNFLVIGSEGGFLPKAVYVPSSVPFNSATFAGSLILGPAERSDVIVDFTNHAGQSLILYTDAPAPFPFGAPRFDFFPGWNVKGNPVNGMTQPGFSPNTRVIVRFNVGTTVSTDPPNAPDESLTITKGTSFLDGIDPLLVDPVTGALNPGVTITRTRQLTLNEAFDDFGRLIQLEGTGVVLHAGTFGRFYLDPATETPAVNDIEVWQIANLTGDTHPIHFHLVNVQIISRQPFNVKTYNGVPSFKGAPVPPDPNERGWKETIRMNPGEVTTVIMKFKLPAVPFTVPGSPRTGDNEYVWHCHILEHEEHDMMRPLVTLSPLLVVMEPAGQNPTVGTPVTFHIGSGKPPYTATSNGSGDTILYVPAGTNTFYAFTVTPGSTGSRTITVTDANNVTATTAFNVA